MGLHPHRAALRGCRCRWRRSADVVQIPRDHGKGQADAPNLKRCWPIEGDKNLPFRAISISRLVHRLGVMPQPVYCTKIRLGSAAPYTDRTA